MVKVTRLKAGYRVTCNDGEMEALRHMVAQGTAGLDKKAHDHLGASAKKSIRRQPFTEPAGPLATTEDRRVA